MKKLRMVLVLFTVMIALAASQQVISQDELAATLLVDRVGVEIKRANTSAWVRVQKESIVGVGDEIRTTASGEASIDFIFVDANLTISPGSTIRIVTFERTGEDEVELEVEMTEGFMSQTLEVSGVYQLIMPGMALQADISESRVRVESDGRSAVLVDSGKVIVNAGDEEVELTTGQGIRSPVDAMLSEIVPAGDFMLLDSQLDGCPVEVVPQGDVVLNVRQGPTLEAPRVGNVEGQRIDRFFGETTDGWYRIRFGGNFGWISSSISDVTIDEECPGLRPFENTHREDPERYDLVQNRRGGVVVVPTANIRLGPGREFRQLDTVTSGTNLVIIGRTADNVWYQVYLGNGLVGWVSADLMTIDFSAEELDIIPVDSLLTEEEADEDEAEEADDSEENGDEVEATEEVPEEESDDDVTATPDATEEPTD
ncbi:MAG: SH3 domain-containing protein [Chloroflexi bacterium]|nr:SH3 domain-containing protein [Chloroflexota bacterium]